MRGFSMVFVGSFLGLSSLAGCAHASDRAVPVAPETTLAAVIEVAPAAANEAESPVEEAPVVTRVAHPVDVTVKHLASPSAFLPKATTYVLWVRGREEDAWSNAAHLAPSKTPEATTFDYPQEALFLHVTAEASPDARRPSDAVVFSARVARDGACASGVDRKDVSIEVKMCR